MTTVVGLDHGSRRIGVAVGDTETGMAFPRSAILRRRLDVDLEAVRALADAEGAAVVVVGLPLNMDGSEGDQAAAARAFGAALSAAGLTVRYEDERLSSWEAEAQMRASGRRRRVDRRGGELDSTAARVILQQYLDARRAMGAREETE